MYSFIKQGEKEKKKARCTKTKAQAAQIRDRVKNRLYYAICTLFFRGGFGEMKR